MLILLQISTNEDWWLFVLWRRVDPRILWTDITMRMEVPQRTAKEDTKWNNRIVNMQRRIWAKHYYMLPWFNRSPVDTTNIHNALRERNIPLHLNTTRGLTPGLVDPNQPNGPRIPRPVLAGLGRRRGPNKNEQKKKTKAGQDPPSEHEEDEDEEDDDEDEDEDEDEEEDDDDDDEDDSSEHEDEEDGAGEDEEEEDQEVCLHSYKT